MAAFVVALDVLYTGLAFRYVSLIHLGGNREEIFQQSSLPCSDVASASVGRLRFQEKEGCTRGPNAGGDRKREEDFITNGGGSNLAFDEFYSDMKTWNKFEIVGSPSAAEIIVELRYVVEDKGTHVWSSTNTYTTGQTQVYSRQMVDPQLSINFYDAKTKDLLWSVTDHRRLARLEKNREKETINSADRLVQNVKDRIGLATPDTPQQVPK